MDTVHYLPFWLRLTLAVVTGTLVLALGAPLNYGVALRSPSFYIAAAVSSISSLIIISSIHYSHVLLDRYKSWESSITKRLFLQTIFGILLPSLLDLVLINTYMIAVQSHVDWNRFLYLDFPLVVGFIVILNLVYIVLYLWSSAKDKFTSDERPDSAQSGFQLKIAYNGTNVSLDPQSDILLLHRSAKLVTVLSTSGDRYQFPETIGKLAQDLKTFGFVQISRSVIVNLDAIQGYRNGSKRDTLEILFKPKYSDMVGKLDHDLLKVTKDHISTLKGSMVIEY